MSHPQYNESGYVLSDLRNLRKYKHLGVGCNLCWTVKGKSLAFGITFTNSRYHVIFLHGSKLYEFK